MAAPPNLTLIANAMKMEKEIFWIRNNHLPADERQRQWTAHTAELNSTLGPAAPTEPLDLGGATTDREMEHQPTIAVHPRQILQPRSPPDDPAIHGLPPQQRNPRQSPAMSRKHSGQSQNNNLQPDSFDSAKACLSVHKRPADNDALRKWQSNTDEPFNLISSKYRRLSSGRPLPILECTEESPSSYLDRQETAQNSSSPAAPAYPQRNTHRLSISPHQSSLTAHPHFLQSPATSTTEGLTEYTAPTSADMSRSSSSICGGIDMMKINSQRSFAASDVSLSAESSPLDRYPFLAGGDHLSSRPSAFDSPHLVDHTGGIADEMSMSQSTGLPMDASISAKCSGSGDFLMKRSSSTETNHSACSNLLSRSRESLTQTPNTRKIAPKISADSLPMSRQSSSSSYGIIRTKSADGTVKEVVPIAKAPYNRPQHEKIKCKHCNDKPDGYRGEHELRRHTDRAHGVLRKAFVCTDISPNKQFLAHCKQCKSNKRYNAYYNAAAHLRRVHFNPKQKGGRKNKAKPEESRGGKGGGDYPSMDICKMWMKEIEEFVSPDMPPYDDNDQDEDIKMSPFNGLPQPTPNAEAQVDFGEAAYVPSSTINIPTATHLSDAVPPFSFSASAHRAAYDSMSLPYLSQNFQATDTAGLLDLSHDVSMHEPADNAGSNMPLPQNPQLFGGSEEIFSFSELF